MGSGREGSSEHGSSRFQLRREHAGEGFALWSCAAGWSGYRMVAVIVGPELCTCGAVAV